MTLRRFLVWQFVLIVVVWGLGWLPSPMRPAHADDNALQQRVQRLEALAKANADFVGSWCQLLDGQCYDLAARELQYANFVDAMVKADDKLQKLWNQNGQPLAWRNNQGVRNDIQGKMGWRYNREGQAQQWRNARKGVR